ncbi:MAG: bifunctional phosphopantothenoylcysteine decarboxylase/phosphopantothenate--cysteine ligase CoaBC [Gammaproteobacteria bacterium]|nr:MAG: bifunctional phosphopantothenoylcysteine decarboxylase/phosphopantothenate--cysteine ligase CoaBC [Gammaproteobacteria bacterium]
MNALLNSRILLGVTGGIAAYKAPQLVRELRQAGAAVQVVMTPSAAQFVTAITLQAVSSEPVRDTLWDATAEASMGHIELARWADLILIAPATADRLSRLATGHADDLLGALCLATRSSIALAPAMNQVMWEAPATQRNLKQLMADGVHIIGPEIGDQACGETGPGRMSEPQEIVRAAAEILDGQPPRARVREISLNHDTAAPANSLTERHLVITAGPTREAIDPVRYISNHSSGKQGYALASAGLAAGARVTLISGPVAEAVPNGVELIPVESAREMHAAALNAAADCDLFIAVAAVADYRPESVAEQKIKKNDNDDEGLHLDLVRNPDIVAAIAGLPDGPVVVGFAAETHDALENARRKLVRKGLDAIVVNDVSRQDIGFGADENAATLIWTDGELSLPKQNKADLSRAILSKLAELFMHRFVRQLANTNPDNAAK